MQEPLQTFTPRDPTAAASPSTQATPLRIDRERLLGRIEALSRITETDRPWTRLAFTDLHQRARAQLRHWMQSAGLSVSLDAAGNLLGNVPARHDGLLPLGTGSHSDTVPGGGRYDGILGVVAAIEVAATLHDRGHQLRHGLEVIDFLAEEPNAFGIHCLGSSAMVDGLSAAVLEREATGLGRLGTAIASSGGDPARILAPVRRAPAFSAFVELHIEQGPVLESAGRRIGVVDSIAGLRQYRATVTGRADHAGTTPMELRRDALAGFAHLANLMAEEAVRWCQRGERVVATIGRATVEPNAPNVVAERVTFSVDVRSGSMARVDAFCAWFESQARLACEARQLHWQIEATAATDPTPCAAVVREAIAAAGADVGVETHVLSSGAVHDTIHMARLGPAGMIFVPSRAGRSHHRDEFTAPADLALGADVLLGTLLRLDTTLD